MPKQEVVEQMKVKTIPFAFFNDKNVVHMESARPGQIVNATYYDDIPGRSSNSSRMKEDRCELGISH